MLFFCTLLIGLCACASSSTISTAATPIATTNTIPTLDDFWEGTAHFELEIEDTGLPMGESDTVILEDGSWRSYVHASYLSAGVVDQCGAEVEFPGCLVTFISRDQGQSFTPAVEEGASLVCQIPCSHCPCDSRRDHIDQQQYPRVAWLSADQERTQDQWVLTYEYRANTILRRSSDGINWSSPSEVPLTGIWRNWLMPCSPEEVIHPHPHAPAAFDCLSGSPPGIFIDTTTSPPELYLFVGMGQNPGSMGCYRSPLNSPPALLRSCDHNPLFVGAPDYGAEEEGSSADGHFDFRTISSADLIATDGHYYLFYEGVRGPGPGDQGDTQFLLGLARATTQAIDGPWERYPGNPILLDLPGNVGVGHADVVVAGGITYLYTSLDGIQRSRLRLVWK